MNPLRNLQLTAGPVPLLLLLTGAAALAGLISATRRGGSTRTVLVCVAAALAATAFVDYLVEFVWKPFPDRLDPLVLLWIALGVLALLLAGVRVVRAPSWRSTALSTAAVGLVVLMGAGQVNSLYSAYPSVEDLLPVDYPATVPRPSPGATAERGVVVRATVPPTRSRFAARQALVYLPPAYLSGARERLPVLMLLHGQPGSPRDWFSGGKLARTMDSYAQRRGGVAPVVVVPDATGGQFANPLCADTRRARAATYLAEDVPAWVRQNLAVDAAPQAWAVGGYSYGGTCALQLATRFPEVFRTFLALSPDAEPDLGGGREATVRDAFAGDRGAYARADPLTQLSLRRFPDSAGVLVAGTEDPASTAAAKRVALAAAGAGMTVRTRWIRGGHDFTVWSGGLTAELDWLGGRLGLPT
ncbi:alpha/beta hydrolase [Tsukamurella ocularis]|uniref:alpha/beta hydrolase n=1 Tax=Tsukamurella ocularis TaxID=1970234 RepID=UPI0021680C0C|nr:alpha/beta hydrolase-fold protein [Tsukamurella ocularis]MCS3779801.1 enterochelin esterase-like enzyme [Tsukamurella ocularis]MCS3788799.1 enterochelin esterase-like enzyme [Tsukamurella ocularis]MCS3850009.1 enterochelin esterase-like enzyme [Tsukamurella ocularis]